MLFSLFSVKYCFSSRVTAKRSSNSKVNFCFLFSDYFISPTIYKQLLRQFPCAEKIQTYSVSTKKLLKRLLHKKAACKMLMKLTPIVHTRNVHAKRYLLMRGRGRGVSLTDTGFEESLKSNFLFTLKLACWNLKKWLAFIDILKLKNDNYKLI